MLVTSFFCAYMLVCCLIISSCYWDTSGGGGVKLASLHRFLHNKFYCVLENIVYEQARGFRADDEQFISQHILYS